MTWWKRKDSDLGSGHDKHPPKEGLIKCKGCEEFVLEEEIDANLKVCPRCDFHFAVGAQERIDTILDPGSFSPLTPELEPQDPLNFEDSKRYKDRIKAAHKKTGLMEAVLVGTGTIDGRRVCIGALAFEYMGG
ncbi:MAG: acetyl-CoA carboxylase carboxyl transferase subunit beta, partial [Pseudomonadota bacterium]